MNYWLVLGFSAQTCFFMRFLVQWIASEREKKSVVPVSFWYLSLVGSLGILIYAIHIRDPVFIAGQSMGSFIYTRNLILIHKEKEKVRAPQL